MAELVEGLDDLIGDEYARLREELRLAIAESDYTLEQVATLAGVGFSTVRAILDGRHGTAKIDTIIRLLFVVGGRVQITAGGERNRPFQVLPLDQASSGNRRSLASSGAASLAAKGQRQSDSAKRTAKVSAKPASKQRRKSAPRKRVTGWFRHHGDDVQKHSRVTREAA